MVDSVDTTPKGDTTLRSVPSLNEKDIYVRIQGHDICQIGHIEQGYTGGRWDRFVLALKTLWSETFSSEITYKTGSEALTFWKARYTAAFNAAERGEKEAVKNQFEGGSRIPDNMKHLFKISLTQPEEFGELPAVTADVKLPPLPLPLPEKIMAKIEKEYPTRSGGPLHHEDDQNNMIRWLSRAYTDLKALHESSDPAKESKMNILVERLNGDIDQMSKMRQGCANDLLNAVLDEFSSQIIDLPAEQSSPKESSAAIERTEHRPDKTEPSLPDVILKQVMIDVDKKDQQGVIIVLTEAYEGLRNAHADPSNTPEDIEKIVNTLKKECHDELAENPALQKAVDNLLNLVAAEAAKESPTP